MAHIVRFNTADDDVIQVIPSGDTTLYLNDSHALINPDLSSLVGVPQKYWKKVGSAAVEMSASEKTAKDSASSSSVTSAIRALADLGVDSFTDVTVLQRGFALVSLDEINTLRQRFNDLAADVAAATSLADLKTRWAAHSTLADRTAAQLKSAVKSKIDAGTAD